MAASQGARETYLDAAVCAQRRLTRCRESGAQAGKGSETGDGPDAERALPLGRGESSPGEEPASIKEIQWWPNDS